MDMKVQSRISKGVVGGYKNEEEALSHMKSPNFYQDRVGHGFPKEKSSHRNEVTNAFISLTLTCPLIRWPNVSGKVEKQSSKNPFSILI